MVHPQWAELSRKTSTLVTQDRSVALLNCGILRCYNIRLRARAMSWPTIKISATDETGLHSTQTYFIFRLLSLSGIKVTTNIPPLVIGGAQSVGHLLLVFSLICCAGIDIVLYSVHYVDNSTAFWSHHFYR